MLMKIFSDIHIDYLEVVIKSFDDKDASFIL